ncbi:Uncharacterised protein [Nocardia otitidiscaviarum]|uniref:Uncharacterized protein n=1 Tax=Nocardia otitidiscaviarum TaxID=1823 RepID=A0A378YTF8_9NOCA|nr:hypothetical protein [Nocardia otitidiscaviarum]SUA80442.1 Uncharacterised protein [Nocardia otitidiscaviarum]
MTTQQTLRSYIDPIKEKELNILNLAATAARNINDRQNEIAFATSLTGSPLPALVINITIDKNQNKIIDAINKCVDGDPANNKPGLKQFIEGMYLPVTLITIAAEWGNIENDIQTAKNSVIAARLSGDWRGDGHDAYEDVRYKDQLPAFTGMVGFAKSTAKILQDFATDVLDFYKDLHTNVLSLINAVEDGLAKLASLQFLEAFVGLIQELTGTIVNLIQNIVTALAKAEIHGGNLVTNTKAVDGLSPDNTWPLPKGDSFKDFSKLDGDKSDWEMV